MPSFIRPRIATSGQSSVASVTRTSTTTTGSSSSRESTSTVATSVPTLLPSFLVQGFYLSPRIPISEEILCIWTEEIKSRLRAVLLYEISVGTCVQEFMIAGKRPNALKPEVVVSCGDVATKKRVMNTFKGLLWLQELLKENDMMFIVVTAKVRLSMRRTLDPSCTSSLKLTESHDLEGAIYATIVSHGNEEDDNARFNMNPPEFETTPYSTTDSADSLVAEDFLNVYLRYHSDQKRDYETFSTTNSGSLASIMISPSIIDIKTSLQKAPTTNGFSYTMPSATGSSQMTTTASALTRRSLNLAWIAGPVLGSILGILTVLLGIFFPRRKQRCEARVDDSNIYLQGESQAKSQPRVEDVPGREGIEVSESPATENYNLAANEIEELRTTAPKKEPVEEWPSSMSPLPLSPLPSLFLMTTSRGESVGKTKDSEIRRKKALKSKAVGECLTADTLKKILEAYCVLLTNPKRSACGFNLLISASKSRMQRHCTLGGLIMINGAVFGLTVGHPFRDHLELGSTHDAQDADTSGDEFDAQSDDDESFVFNADDADPLETTSDSITVLLQNNSLLASRTINHSNFEYIIPIDPATREFPPCNVIVTTTALSLRSESPPVYLDWAILQTLPYSVSKVPNRITNTDSNGDVFVEAIISLPAQGEVTILVAGKQPQEGYLHSPLVTMRIDDLVLEVCIITSDRFLPLGCSGAWVVFEEQLCGLIVAIRDDIPWAYMAPIEPILENIKTKLGTNDVRLPRRGEVESISRNKLLAC